MSQLKSFDSDAIRKLDSDLNALLGEFAKKHGIAVQPVSLRYNRVECNIRTSFTVSDDMKGTAYAKEAADFKRFAKSFGLEPEMLGKTFTTYKGDTLEVIGLRPSSRMYPVLVKKLSNGKLFKYPVSIVRVSFDRAGAFKKSATQATEFQAGVRVKALYAEDGKWYPATYVKKLSDGTHRIRWTDGSGLDTVDQVKTR